MAVMAADLEIENELEPEQPRRTSGLTKWLIAFGLLILFLGLYLVSATIRETNDGLTEQLDTLRATLTVVPEPLPGREDMSATRMALLGNVSALQDTNAMLEAQHVNWPEIINLLADYNTSQLNLSGIVESEDQIVVTGIALDEVVVMNYSDRLRQSYRFDRVVIQSITVRTYADSASSQRSSVERAAPIAGPQYVEFVLTLQLGNAS
jgi:hypothetical protein